MMHTSLKLLGLYLCAALQSEVGEQKLYTEVLRLQLCSSQRYLCDTVMQLPCITSGSYIGSLQAEVPLFHCVLSSRVLATSSGLWKIGADVYVISLLCLQWSIY